VGSEVQPFRRELDHAGSAAGQRQVSRLLLCIFSLQEKDADDPSGPYFHHVLLAAINPAKALPYMGARCAGADAGSSTSSISGTDLNDRSPVILSVSWLGINVAEAQSMLSDLACTPFTIPMLPSPSHRGRGAALFSELFYVDGCIRPVHNLLCYGQPLL